MRKTKQPEGRPVWEKRFNNLKPVEKPKRLGVKKKISTRTPLTFGI